MPLQKILRLVSFKISLQYAYIEAPNSNTTLHNLTYGA
jgi:hypothetical protein